jgi:hypothetical protein
MAHSIGTWTNISDADPNPNPNPRISTPFWHWTYPLSEYFLRQTLAQGVQRGLAPQIGARFCAKKLRHCARRIDRNGPDMLG